MGFLIMNRSVADIGGGRRIAEDTAVRIRPN